jgi:radical SAM superfamily enzyme YgiQ (UPF0313 family)
VARVRELVAARPEVRHVDFVDDNFFVDRKRVLAVAAGIAREAGLSFTSNGGRVKDLLRYSDEDLAELARCGLTRIDLGVETASEYVADLVDKHDSPAEVREVCRRLTRVGIAPWINLLVGFPGESEDDLRRTAALAVELPRRFRPLFVSPLYAYTPYPGTRLYEKLREMGHKPPTHEELARSGWNRPETPWLTGAERSRLSRLYFYSLFTDRKILIYRGGWWVRALLALFRPIARRRVSRLRLGFPLAQRLFERFVGKDY